MKKQYVELKFKGQLIGVCPIKEAEPLDFVKIKKEAEANFAALFDKIENKINNLEKDVKILKGEE